MKYDIHTRPPQPSDETIAKHQDFDALFAQFAQQPNAKPNNPKPQGASLTYWLAPLAAAAIALGWYLFTPASNPNTPNAEPPLALIAPLPNIQKPFATYQLPSNKDTSIQHPSGTKINVPAAAFIDKNGQPVSGPVDIQYREMHDHVDLFIAGVPQVANQHKTNQTAAALQIQGYQNGEPIYINQDKPLQVELHTQLPPDLPTKDLAIYTYKSQDSNWYFQQADQIEILSQTEPINPNPTTNPDEPTSKQAYLAQLEQQFPAPKAPTRHNSATDNRETFDIDFKTTDFPEFAHFKDLLWAITDNKQKFQSVLTQREWESMNIQRSGDDQYLLVLVAPDKTISLQIEPVASNPKDAEKIYQNQLAAYNKATQDRQTKIRNLLAQWQAPNQLVQDSAIASRTVIHRFKVNTFGLWAAAKSNPNPNPNTPIQILDNSDGPEPKIKTIFAANPDQRIYFSIPNPQPNQPLPVADTPLLWAIDDQNQLRPLQKSKSKPNQYLLLPPNPNAYTTEDQLRQYLNSPKPS